MHNAGSIGQFGFTQEWDSVDQLSKYHELNVLSVYYFNSRYSPVALSCCPLCI